MFVWIQVQTADSTRDVHCGTRTYQWPHDRMSHITLTTTKPPSGGDASLDAEKYFIDGRELPVRLIEALSTRSQANTYILSKTTLAHFF